MVRKKATSSLNGQSSFAVMTDSFVEPNQDNFGSLIIRNGSPTSNKIKELIESTKSWLKTETVSVDEPQSILTEKQQEQEAKEFEPIAFKHFQVLRVRMF